MREPITVPECLRWAWELGIQQELRPTGEEQASTIQEQELGSGS